MQEVLPRLGRVWAQCQSRVCGVMECVRGAYRSQRVHRSKKVHGGLDLGGLIGYARGAARVREAGGMAQEGCTRPFPSQQVANWLLMGGGRK